MRGEVRASGVENCSFLLWRKLVNFFIYFKKLITDFRIYSFYKIITMYAMHRLRVPSKLKILLHRLATKGRVKIFFIHAVVSLVVFFISLAFPL